MAERSVAATVVTYDAMPWVERCLESLEGTETVVVDHGSTDGTLDLVRGRFPAVRLVEQENRGLAAGWNRGLAETAAELVLVVNSDAWLVGDGLAELVRVAERRPDAGLIG
ncbi:MAG: glycosyltransferase, partial [Actinobacteria bacterium]|nr:glycosyltransferase [Actinomycetota bacterium]